MQEAARTSILVSPGASKTHPAMQCGCFRYQKLDGVEVGFSYWYENPLYLSLNISYYAPVSFVRMTGHHGLFLFWQG